MNARCGHCRSVAERVDGDWKCPNCKARKEGNHWVWMVPASAWARDKYDWPIAAECAECGFRTEADKRGVGYILRERPCPISEWKTEVSGDGE